MKKEILSEVLMSVCVLVLGICLTIWADKVTKLVSILLGVIAVIYGLSALISYFSNKEKVFNDNMEFIVGIVVLVIGGVLIFKVDFLKELVSFIIGIYILLASALRLSETIKLGKKLNSKMTTSVVLSIIGIVLGIMCITFKFLFPDMIVTYIGILLIIYSVINIANLVIVGRK
ncbi:MAG: DUF308 domain-containing protein [Bacilli bacterium]|nr:DUF308 domain-containing protein [Bacilli bacterium]